MKGKEQEMSYEAPMLEVIEVEVEKGFAASPENFENGGPLPEN